nr:disease resistance protein RPM1-like [Quercus suber]
MVKQFCKARKEFPPEGIDSADKISLISKAREYLQEKRYVVVFDDVWEIDFWGEIEHALPDNTKGPRILITTRKLDVANFCKKSSHVKVHNLQPLLPNKAWELFCKRAFQFELGGHCPPMLQKLSHDILEKCEGLPLVVVAIGGLLSTKDKTLFEWQKLHDSLGFELGINPHLAGVSKILSLSFEDLPYNLKSCFLYLGMYPEDDAIRCNSLIRQWIAEGFVKAKEGKTLEDVAREYLTELIHRSLVQVAKVDFDGKALTVLQYVDTNYGGVNLIEELGKLSQLESLSLVNLTRETGRALCVSIGNMICLKYLFVSSINEDEIIDLQPISSPPKCLQFLRIEGRLAKLPDWISELQHLVSLKIYWTRLSNDPLKAFQNLPNLAELRLAMKAYNGEQLHIGKGGFPKLKELRLIGLSELNSVNIEKDAFPLLEKLDFGGFPQLEVPSGFQHLRNLKKLNIGDMPTEFEKSLDPEQGSHYWIIQHVPFILFYHKVRKGMNGYESRNLRSKDLERSRGQTINQDDDSKNNISGDDISTSVEKG